MVKSQLASENGILTPGDAKECRLDGQMALAAGSETVELLTSEMYL